MRLSVAVPPGTQKVEYWLNGELYQTAGADPWWVWWALVPGDYTLVAKATLTDGSVQTSPEIPFTVVSFGVATLRRWAYK